MVEVGEGGVEGAAVFGDAFVGGAVAGLGFLGGEPEEQGGFAVAFFAEYLEVGTAVIEYLLKLGWDDGNFDPLFVGQGAKGVAAEAEGVEGEEF